MSRDSVYLLDITAAASRINAFTAGLTKEEFISDERTQFAVLHLVMIIGEASRRLSDEFRAEHMDLPLRDAIAMRNIIVHQYDAVDLDLVWQTAVEEIPRLHESLRHIHGGQTMEQGG
jgi:uncharacterized protein with HEPN domain